MTGMSDKQDNDEMGREMDLDEDWRSFRAKLVWSESEAGAPRNDAETSSDVRMQEGSLWLHQLPIPEKGCLMLANPTQFGDSQSYFSQSIIVLIEYGVLGTVGFINNRPTPHLVGEFAQTHRVFLHCPLFFGGPVGETVQVLHRVGKVKGAKMIVPGLFHGGDLDHAGSLVESGEAKLEDFRFFYKHSSWGPGQLEDEVTQEVWFPSACSTGMIFRPTSIAHAHTHTDKSQWHFCMHKLGGNFVKLSQSVKLEESLSSNEFVTQWMTVLSADEARPECGAVLIARVKDHSVTQALVDIELDAIAQAARDELKQALSDKAPTDEQIVQALNKVLFEKVGIEGDRLDYYNPMNSYIHQVLKRKRGNPITISVIYMAVAWRLGLELTGVNSPRHFLVQIRTKGREGSLSGALYQYIDPFNGGKLLSLEEALDKFSMDIPDDDSSPEQLRRSLLSPAPALKIYSRMLRNLVIANTLKGLEDDAVLFSEALEALEIAAQNVASEELSQ